jgi:hypothetical protein
MKRIINKIKLPIYRGKYLSVYAHTCQKYQKKRTSALGSDPSNQGCQIFLGKKYQNGKIYKHIATNCTKCP